jgi:hypothetical protein
MKHILTILCCILFLNAKPQTCTIGQDFIEVYTWFGNWNTPANTGFYTNASVSPNVSAVLYGNGSGSSVIESANYIMPNITGLNPAYAHKFSFRLASYRFSDPTAATVGVDGPDYVDVRYSTNAGTTYTTEIRIAGFGNAYWDYNTLGVASKIPSGTITTYAPTAGGNRSTTGDGYSVIELTIPAGPTQLAFILSCRVNAAGEEWWIDNVELTQLGPCVVLPITLVTFKVTNKSGYNLISWKTSSEINNHYFTLYRSIDGINWTNVAVIEGIGTTSIPQDYSFADGNYLETMNYYKLTQTDYNGVITDYDIIYINNINKQTTKVVKIVNLFGQEVHSDSPGHKIYIYEDGSTQVVLD